MGNNEEKSGEIGENERQETSRRRREKAGAKLENRMAARFFGPKPWLACSSLGEAECNWPEEEKDCAPLVCTPSSGRLGAPP